MTGTITRLPDLGWMLRPLTEIPGVRHAVVVSEDGLRLGHLSAENLSGTVAALSVAEAESLSAACAAITMTARSTASLVFGGGSGVRQLMLESEHGFVLFTQAGLGAHLGVATDTGADVGLVAQQMQLLVAKIGAHLSSQPRDQVAPSPSS
ncbi:roadblock/LC7 domain-containing protein [Streptomyces sp. HNM0663]|uniref:Roadblock/LC7 domain-containing protein n=1 Tax=Streptomyces chengmaiensis TaxID=3040919 RepID=A0ABT6HMA8_9ACTN|nr:roadblock/LC7 domain-containing protein [Streptomyces chengmaiensis]MDH2389847.1 roadblock/LC7 domain-containing protein [Streptomyces chengmaiensis]